MLDLYTDYLISQNKYATATGLSDMVGGDVSHDKVTRFLNGDLKDSQALWAYVKPIIRGKEQQGGVLILDDTTEEKPYTDENDIVCWHHCHSKNRHIKGMNILSCLVRYDDITLPVGYEIVKKEVRFCEVETQSEKRRASIGKNEHFQSLIGQAFNNKVLFDHVLADNWFAAKGNLDYIHYALNKKFIIGIKSNRTVTLNGQDKKNKNVTKVKDLDWEDGKARKVWLKANAFPVLLIKKVFTNEDGTNGILYLISNDLDLNENDLYKIYQKRWDIETYHKSIKQNASLAKSPTKRVRSQKNHIFASIVAFCKLETLRFKTALNHFAIKYKLLINANQAALQKLREIQNLTPIA